MSTESPMPQPQAGKSELLVLLPFGETNFRVTRANAHEVQGLLGRVASAREAEAETEAPISLDLQDVGTFYVNPDGVDEYSRGHYMAGALQMSATRIVPAHLRLTQPHAARRVIDKLLHGDNRTVEAIVDTPFKLPPA